MDDQKKLCDEVWDVLQGVEAEVDEYDKNLYNMICSRLEEVLPHRPLRPLRWSG